MDFRTKKSSESWLDRAAEFIGEANSPDEVRRKFNRHNDEQLRAMIDRNREMTRSGPLDRFKRLNRKIRRHGQAMDAAYRLMWRNTEPTNESVERLDEMNPWDKGYHKLHAWDSKHGGYRRKTALLPTNTRIHPDRPEKNEFVAGWKGHAGVKYLHVTQDKHDWGEGKTVTKHAVIAGGASEKVGDEIHGMHDQTMRDMGKWSVRHVTDDPRTITHKHPMPLMVFK